MGNWRAEHLFTLKQSRRLYQTYQDQILECDREIQKFVRTIEARVDPSEKPLPPDQKANQGRNKAMKTKTKMEARFEQALKEGYAALLPESYEQTSADLSREQQEAAQ